MPDQKPPNPMAIVGYFVLAFPAAALPALLLGLADSPGPGRDFEGSAGMGVVLNMMVAYGFSLLVILCAYVGFHGKARALYVANGILFLMVVLLLIVMSLSGAG